MAPVATQFSGSLLPKNKTELKSIASALTISDAGTREELQARIKAHLDAHSKLENDPRFAGLYGRKSRKSVEKEKEPTPSASAKPNSSRFAPRKFLLDSPIESTPVKDLRDVSLFLKSPDLDEEEEEDVDDDEELELPLSRTPVTPVVAAERSMMINPATYQQTEEAIQTSFLQLRTFLSNSRNIWSLTAIFELLYILNNVIPWEQYSIGEAVTIRYPPLDTLQSANFWSILAHWFIPTLLVPVIFGTLISFRRLGTGFDPLTASIVRVAAQIAYPLKTDPLGIQWRVLSAGVGLAFAFSEAILLS